MRTRIALLLACLSTLVVVGVAPAQARTAGPAYDTNWPCAGC
jgi:hypothetical protein